jgi:hypothetical protein
MEDKKITNIKQLVITEVKKLNGNFPEKEYLDNLVKKYFPTSKWQDTHYSWYKSQIKRKIIKVDSDELNDNFEKTTLKEMEKENAVIEVITKENIKSSLEFQNVQKIANELHSFLSQQVILDSIAVTHKIHAKSGQIQDIILPKAQELGFASEKKGLFEKYLLRPDYYKKLGENKGIIMEVERGKSLTNNMDLLDVWKCHICEEANYLFLIVPQIRQTEKGSNTKIFNAVVKRLQSFFYKKNYINIDAIFIFGY